MATFKKYDRQETRQVNAKLASGTATWNVGDLFSYIPSTEVAAKITKASEVQTALGSGYEVYLVAQGDMITNGTATGYKEYKITDTVAMSTTAKVVVGYKVTDVSNIDGYEAE